MCARCLCVCASVQGLKSLRRVEARAAPEEFNKLVYLYRGMKDTKIVDQKLFMKEGGTELYAHTCSSKPHRAHARAVNRCLPQWALLLPVARLSGL